MKAFRTVLIVASLICLGTAANAHPRPKTATPEPNAVLKTSPTEIRLGFNEGVVGKYSGIELRGSHGLKIEEGKAALDPDDDKQLVLEIINPLAPGTYKVKWHVVGEDMRSKSGHYKFQVKS